MTVKKVLNNNVAIVLNDLGQECVVSGRGIVFDKKQGDKIVSEKVEKTFFLRENGQAEKLSRLIDDIPPDHFKVCEEIIAAAKKELPGLNDSIYLSLIDHISFAIERHKENLDIASSLKGELKRFYPNEFRVGLMALDIIEKHFAIRLPDDEAAFVAFHLINAGTSVNANLEEELRLSKGILELIKNHFAVEFNEDSAAYDRLLIHLKYFSRRIFEKEAPGIGKISGGLLYRLEAEMPGETSCVNAISVFVKDLCHYTIDDDEKSYLIIHLHSLLKAGSLPKA
ncbi:MAG: PRD domain-containing protein [Spirochaetaceae bacterium]|nr:PRD domain-containing protein [Spirochaetaceae bacterium]